jgi:anti-anti-sigma factor
MTYSQKCQMIVLQPQGRLDVQGGIAFREQLDNLVPQPQDLWVIDLAQVDFMDNSGLIALVKGLKAARQSGCHLVFCNVQPPIRIILELTQLDEVFEIFESYDAVMTTVENAVLTT